MKRCLVCLALGSIIGGIGGVWVDRTIRGHLASLPLPDPFKTSIMEIYGK